MMRVAIVKETEVELELGQCFETLCLRGRDARAYQIVLELARLGIRSLPARILLGDGECDFRVILDPVRQRRTDGKLRPRNPCSGAAGNGSANFVKNWISRGDSALAKKTVSSDL